MIINDKTLTFQVPETYNTRLGFFQDKGFDKSYIIEIENVTDHICENGYFPSIIV